MKYGFQEVMDRLLGKLLGYGTEFQAELNKLEHIKTEHFERILSENEFKEFQRVIGVMSKTSAATVSTFRHMENACLEMLKNPEVSPDKSKKKAVQKIMVILDKARKEELAYARRLPFSIGGGWAPGFSPVRHLVNAAGYLLLAPGLATSSKARAMYAKSLSTLQETMKGYTRIRQEQENQQLRAPQGFSRLHAKFDSHKEQENVEKEKV